MGIIAKFIAYIVLIISGIFHQTGPVTKTIPVQISTTVLSAATSSSTISLVPPPTATPSGIPENIPTLSKNSFPKANPMATAGELFITINAYRTSHGLTAVRSNGSLCRIAQSRANDQQAAGQLDNHAGFVAAAHTQSEFHHVAEILQYWDVPEDATYLVDKGWAQSGEHNAIMLDPSWTNGCGGVSGFYSVFIFAKI